MFGALGDIHGDFDSARRIMERHRQVPFWLCVGDVADAEGNYQSLPSPLYWIKGNNENFDVIAAEQLPAGLHHLANGRVAVVHSVRVAGLGGTHAPTLYDTPAAELPHPKKGSVKATEAADRRRHFVREEVDACKNLRDIDVFMSHEAPRPFRVQRGIDAGKTPINEVLAAMRPKLHLFGHHHRFAEAVVSGVPSICMDLVSKSYLLIDAKTLNYQHLPSYP